MIRRLVVILMAFFFSSLARGDEDRFIEVFKDLSLQSGLVLDRSSDRDTISCASTGMVSYAKAIAWKRGTMGAEELDRVRAGFRQTLATNPEKNKGWLYHFTDVAGQPKKYSEVSTIDSALFYYSFLKAAETMGDADFKAEVEKAIAAVDQESVLKDGWFRHGFYWKGDSKLLIDWLWDDRDESVLLYRLFDRPNNARIDLDLPLFCYYYPLCFDRSPDQIELLRKACQRQKERWGHVGVTACDGPHGYQAGDPKVISPLAIYAASPFSELAKAELEALTCPRTLPAFSGSWQATDALGIDYASTYILTREASRAKPVPETSSPSPNP